MLLQRIKLKNFKRFSIFDTTVDKGLNVLIGDNESGKSTILLALDLLLGGNRRKIEAIGLESLFNTAAIDQFLRSERRLTDLPELYVEAYLGEQNNPDLNGKNNSEIKICDGLRLRCMPNDALSDDIRLILAQKDASFPFEYYAIDFNTFSGKSYFVHNRPIRHLVIDSSQINNEYATREYVKGLYSSNVEGNEKHKHQNEYRSYKDRFGREVLGELNRRVEKYAFAVRTSGKASLEAELTISEEGIPIENKGKGQQCFIKTEFALKKPRGKAAIDVLLLEEPENHLSHVNMKKLIHKIAESEGKQLFIATHSNLICARLDLRKCILLNSSGMQSALLDDVPDKTAEFFMKAPDNYILEFVLSQRAILVEGDAEYILLERFYEKESGSALEDSDIHVISIGGTSFKRYLDLAKLLEIKTAVIRDNDGDYHHNCVQDFAAYSCSHIKIFSDTDDSRKTFEICLYEANKKICEDLFGEQRRTLGVQEYMLSNKTEAAFSLLQSNVEQLSAPEYIRKAIQWIRS